MSENTIHSEIDESLRQSIVLEDDPFNLTLGDVHGLADKVAKLRDVFIPGVAEPAVPVYAPSLVIYGPEGVGKTRLARAVVSALAARDFTCVSISATALTDRDSHRQHRGDAELAEVINSLTDTAPAVLYVEDFQEMQFAPDRHFQNAIAAIRGTTTRVAVVCTLTQSHPRFTPTNTPEYFEFADFLLHLESASPERRAAILADELASLTADVGQHDVPDVSTAITRASPSFDVGEVPDIARRAVLLAGTRSTPMQVTTDDVVTAIEQVATERSNDQSDPHGDEHGGKWVEPSVPAVTFDDIGGLDEQIQRLQVHLQCLRTHEQVYAESTFSPATGVLLYGPPGTGKTLLAKALATETDRTFIAVEGSAVKSKWFGQSEQRVRDLFETARKKAPSIIFFDEFDALARDRQTTGHSAVRSIVNTLLAELDGIDDNDGVFVVAATNFLDTIDPAVRRHGRLGETIEIPPPDEAGQQEIFDLYTDGIQLAADVDADWFVSHLPSESTGADIAHAVELAFRHAVARTDGKTEVTILRSDIRYAIDDMSDGSSEASRSFR